MPQQQDLHLLTDSSRRDDWDNQSMLLAMQNLSSSWTKECNPNDYYKVINLHQRWDEQKEITTTSWWAGKTTGETGWDVAKWEALCEDFAVHLYHHHAFQAPPSTPDGMPSFLLSSTSPAHGSSSSSSVVHTYHKHDPNKSMWTPKCHILQSRVTKRKKPTL